MLIERDELAIDDGILLVFSSASVIGQQFIIGAVAGWLARRVSGHSGAKGGPLHHLHRTQHRGPDRMSCSSSSASCAVCASSRFICSGVKVASCYPRGNSTCQAS
jgi:hypothetical protein